MSKTKIGDDIGERAPRITDQGSYPADEINNLVKDIVKYKTHKFDKVEDKVKDEDEDHSLIMVKGLDRIQ